MHLLVLGDNDKTIPLEYYRQYNEIPISKYVVIKNCGHIPHIEKPIESGRVSLDFLLLDNNKQEGNKLPSG